MVVDTFCSSLQILSRRAILPLALKSHQPSAELLFRLRCMGLKLKQMQPLGAGCSIAILRLVGIVPGVSVVFTREILQAQPQNSNAIGHGRSGFYTLQDEMRKLPEHTQGLCDAILSSSQTLPHHRDPRPLLHLPGRRKPVLTSLVSHQSHIWQWSLGLLHRPR